MSGASVDSRDRVTSKKTGKLSLGTCVFVQEILSHRSEWRYLMKCVFCKIILQSLLHLLTYPEVMSCEMRL